MAGLKKLARSAVERVALQVGRYAPMGHGVRVLGYHDLPGPDVLVEQVRLLRRFGSIIDEDEFFALKDAGEWPTDDLRFLLTVDDGLAMNFTQPMLEAVEQLGIRPVLYCLAIVVDPEQLATMPELETDKIGTPKPLVTPEALRRGLDAGWTLGSHTWSHLNCGAASADEVERQIHLAATALRDNFGVPVRSFAWPWGQRKNTSDAGRAALTAAGHDVAFAAVGGGLRRRPNDWHFVSRGFIDTRWSPSQFEGALHGALDHLP